MRPLDGLRAAAAVAVAVGGYEHFDLYRHGYHAIHNIGPLFALNVIASAGLAAALVTRRDRATAAVAAVFTVTSLGAFVLSRTSGLLGFKETGLQPSPQAPTTLVAEVLALALLATVLLLDRRRIPATAPVPT
jgi:hypothetical protein